MNNLVGRLCVKIAGRESGRHCIIVDVIDDNSVIIDGNVKRRKCNINHLEFLNKKANIAKGASTEQTLEAMRKIGIEIMTKTKKERTPKTQENKEEKSQKKEEKKIKNKKADK